jgi:hypothetical protein
VRETGRGREAVILGRRGATDGARDGRVHGLALLAEPCTNVVDVYTMLLSSSRDYHPLAASLISSSEQEARLGRRTLGHTVFVFQVTPTTFFSHFCSSVTCDDCSLNKNNTVDFQIHGKKNVIN